MKVDEGRFNLTAAALRHWNCSGSRPIGSTTACWPEATHTLWPACSMRSPESSRPPWGPSLKVTQARPLTTRSCIGARGCRLRAAPWGMVHSSGAATPAGTLEACECRTCEVVTVISW